MAAEDFPHRFSQKDWGAVPGEGQLDANLSRVQSLVQFIQCRVAEIGAMSGERTPLLSSLRLLNS
jgi:hypothetical protein